MEVWGDEAAMEEARQQREDNKEKAKQKKFDKKIKGLGQRLNISVSNFAFWLLINFNLSLVITMLA